MGIALICAALLSICLFLAFHFEETVSLSIAIFLIFVLLFCGVSMLIHGIDYDLKCEEVRQEAILLEANKDSPYLAEAILEHNRKVRMAQKFDNFWTRWLFVSPAYAAADIIELE